MKSAGKARSNGLYRHIRTSKEIIRNLLNYYEEYNTSEIAKLLNVSVNTVKSRLRRGILFRGHSM